ncbi:hypothetical protein FDW83_17685 [Pseudarthrobacter sp. NamE2]|nr:hypothetical protein FDW83_17685 [Pseudarthrobacter sp. NamE2]
MKKISNRRNSATSLTLRAKTGSHCPASGFWCPEDRSIEPIFVFEGSIMPPTGPGKSTLWHLEDGYVGPPAYSLP